MTEPPANGGTPPDPDRGSGLADASEPGSDEAAGTPARADGASPSSDPAESDRLPADRSTDGRYRSIDRRRIDEVFGESWPETTEDERGPGERSGFDAEHYRRHRPPHHLGR